MLVNNVYFRPTIKYWRGCLFVFINIHGGQSYCKPTQYRERNVESFTPFRVRSRFSSKRPLENTPDKTSYWSIVTSYPGSLNHLIVHLNICPREDILITNSLDFTNLRANNLWQRNSPRTSEIESFRSVTRTRTWPFMKGSQLYIENMNSGSNWLAMSLFTVYLILRHTAEADPRSGRFT
jgi:hypothetical protein